MVNKLRLYLLVMVISLALFFVSTVLHNYLSALFGTEEPVFFVIAVIISPIGILVGGVGTIVFGIKEIVLIKSKRRVVPVRGKKPVRKIKVRRKR